MIMVGPGTARSGGHEADWRRRWLVGSVEDVTDVRTRLIYASLEDDELVRQLREAQRIAARRRGRGVGGSQAQVVDVRDVADLEAAGPHRPSEWSVDDSSNYLG